MQTSVEELYNGVGARSFLIFNLPDLGIRPLVGSPEDAQLFTEGTEEYNELLAERIDNLQNSLADINIVPVDIDSLLEFTRDNPEAFGFINTEDSFLPRSPLVDNPDEFLFWDGEHPTRAAHEFVGEFVFQNLLAASNPHNVSVSGDSGINIIIGGSGDDKLNGGFGNDLLVGNFGNDTLNGGFGNDLLSGGIGDDKINAGFGDDKLEGSVGNDTLNGGFGSDTLKGGFGNDKLNAGSGDDELNGGSGHDLLNGNMGNDTLDGDVGSDKLNGGLGDDELNGGSGEDLLNGSVGNDTLNGDADNDKLNGGVGNDELNGGSGDDLLNGRSGDDLLNGGAGDDKLNGGVGRDTFVFDSELLDGLKDVDTIRNFQIDDVLDFADYLSVGGAIDFTRVSRNLLRVDLINLSSEVEDVVNIFGNQTALAVAEAQLSTI